MSADTLTVGFSSTDAARILRIPVQQIAAWQRAGLLRKPDGSFTLRDMGAMRRLRSLRGSRPAGRSERQWAAALRSCLREEAEQEESRTVRSGARLVVRHGGALLDPLTQQFGFDFEACSATAAGAPELVRMPTVANPSAVSEAGADPFNRAQDLFQQAVLLEESALTVAAAADLYREVLALWPAHAPASVNLGTLLYNQQRFAEAEQCYRRAAAIDPDYALAFFDLGNVLDELQRLPEAIDAYLRAIQLAPQYADAHYNLALAYERTGERRRALRHWMRYVRLDPIGPWAAHARTQARKTLSSEKLRVVSRYGRRA
ncbi:tetratricopeptide repeat protein [Terriglobus aquaticus]|uniref:Tetratricopeptide repeat protein n=1 Tax=Terriglobus aquaticus TaxID=940139 RepID=A0ABW9KGG3_9BACT|nr:tetratricopeptide repeat protein [Terriglobus aquaticus]